ncbi:MAG TPA: MATE family efflux transporter, partial [Spirochaetia bacterium]|nr:MATE family efflux transporter [Spirochaetia bacterium]
MKRDVPRQVDGMFDGPVLPLVVRLALPILAGMLFQFLYTIVDTLMVSWINPEDPSYVGGIGIVFPIIFFAMAVGMGLQVGISSLVARSIGRDDHATLDSAAESGLALAFGFTVILMTVFYVFGADFIRLLGAQDDYVAGHLYYTHAVDYLMFILPAGAAVFFGMTLNGILQGEGLMKYVMIAMILGTVVNIILDAVFIFGLGWEVKG